MANPRRKLSQAEEVALVAQVDSHCPLCDAKLFYQKNRRSHKAYEIAHIYPLNPTKPELEELKGIAPPSDLNEVNNLVPLCTGCHTKFDKPRNKEEYRELRSVKDRLIAKVAQRALNAQYPLEQQISAVVDALHRVAAGDDVELQFEPKGLDEKFNETLPGPTRRKIKNAVTDYYNYVRGLFRDVENDDPSSSQLIFTQVKAYYLKQKALGKTQAEAFTNIVEWIQTSANAQSLEAAEAVASFFVQNCEVFE